MIRKADAEGYTYNSDAAFRELCVLPDYMFDENDEEQE